MEEIREKILDEIHQGIQMIMINTYAVDINHVKVYIPRYIERFLFDNYETKGTVRLTHLFGHEVLPNWDKKKIVISNVMDMSKINAIINL